MFVKFCGMYQYGSVTFALWLLLTAGELRMHTYLLLHGFVLVESN